MYVLADNIRKLRQKFCITQEELAEKIGVSKGTISNYENDITRPACSKLPKIADAFGVRVRDLFEGTIRDYGFDENYEYNDKIDEVKSPNPELFITGIPYLFIYEDENNDIVICVSQTGEYMLLEEYKHKGNVLTSCANTYYVLDLNSTDGEQFACGSHNVGQIVDSKTYSSQYE